MPMFPHIGLPDPSCHGLASPLEYEAREAPRHHLESHWRYRLLVRLEECAHRARAACIACFPCRAHTGMPEPFCAISLLLLAAPARIMWGWHLRSRGHGARDPSREESSAASSGTRPVQRSRSPRGERPDLPGLRRDAPGRRASTTVRPTAWASRRALLAARIAT